MKDRVKRITIAPGLIDYGEEPEGFKPTKINKAEYMGYAYFWCSPEKKGDWCGWIREKSDYIVFYQKKKYSFTFCEYNDSLLWIFNYWKTCGTVKVINGLLIILNISFAYTQELMINRKLKFKVITEL